jgi:deoxyribose-phosphate aldolase
LLSPARYIDHTLLKPDATADQIRRLCEEAVEYGFASVCIPPVYVRLAAAQLYGSEVAVGTVVGFPLGYSTLAAKICETREAVAAGADEIDMVIHLGAVLAGDLQAVEAEIREVTKAARSARVKVILECCYLDDSLKTALVERVVAGGAAYVKTSTGFGPGGATEADVRLLASTAAGRVGVKAAGGIRDWATCRTLLAAGATRIGSSAGITILNQWQLEEGQ